MPAPPWRYAGERHDQALQLDLPVDFRAAGAVIGGHANLLARAPRRCVQELREQRRILRHLKVHFPRRGRGVVRNPHTNLAELISRQRMNSGEFPQFLTVTPRAVAPILLASSRGILRVAKFRPEPAA